MAKIKLETLAIVAIAGVLLFTTFGEQAPAGPDGEGGIDLCKVVEPSATFTGQRMFLSGTALTGEWTRIIKLNGGDTRKDLGQTSLNSGTQTTAANGNYRLYHGENSTLYYTAAEDYQAPCQDAPDDKLAVMCLNGTPTLTIFDEFGNVQTTTANGQTVDADDEVQIKVRVQVPADQCFGNPGAPDVNAICFRYNTTEYKSVATDTGSHITPYAVSNENAATGAQIDCYKLELLSDNEMIDVPVTIKSQSTNPTATSGAIGNVSIYVDDIAFDIDADTLEEIWGFQDEDNNVLANSPTTGMVRVA